MIDVVFLINTYNRQESCQRLVDSLQGQGRIIVLNDGCDYVINGCEQNFLTQHNGKMYYWLTVKKLFSLRGSHQYYIMLPDDFLPVENMVERAVGVWLSIGDLRKATLNLYTDRLGQSCWTAFKAIDFGDYYQTQWVDMCFLCRESFFGLINLQPVSPSLIIKPNASSGVGAMISRQINRRKWCMYQVKEGLVIPQKEHHISQMRNDENNRQLSALSTNRRKRIVFNTRKR